MANVTVIARPGKIQTDDVVVTLHAVRTETHDLSNTVTDHPVEEGFNVSDHSRPEPDRVTMDCVISNTPITPGQQKQIVQQGQFQIETEAQARGRIGDAKGFAYGEWAKLKKLRLEGTLTTVVTTLGEYRSMAIVSITLPRSAKNADSVEFTISFKRIRVVKNKLTRTTTSRDPSAQTKKKTGAQTKKTESDEIKSEAAAGADALRGIKSVNDAVTKLGKLL